MWAYRRNKFFVPAAWSTNFKKIIKLISTRNDIFDVEDFIEYLSNLFDTGTRKDSYEKDIISIAGRPLY